MPTRAAPALPLANRKSPSMRPWSTRAQVGQAPSQVGFVDYGILVRLEQALQGLSQLGVL
jgi:hypothetical protein